MMLLAFQTHQARASSPTGSEYNHALASHGAVAAASGNGGGTTPGNAIDGLTSTYWQSSSTTGWLSVQFATMAYVNEIHAHFRTTVYSSLSLYLDTSGNGAYETNEKLWSTTANTALDVIANLPSVTYALGMKVTIDLKNGNNNPKINEFEAYLRDDSDGDGLTNAYEVATTYFQDMQPGGLPRAIPDDGANSSSSSVSLAQFYGVPIRALANFTMNHSKRTDLTASIGYWNGSAWIDRYIWDPGKHLLAIGITQPDAVYPYSGTVAAVATVAHPEITSKVEFRVNGTLQATVTSPVGGEYRWNWVTPNIDALMTFNVTQYDVDGGRAWDQHTVIVNNLGPAMSWVSPASNATVSGTITVQASASDYWRVQSVTFYMDNKNPKQLTRANCGSNYCWTLDTTGTSNGAHTLKIVAFDTYGKSTTVTRSVTVSNDLSIVITTPIAGSVVSGTVYVNASVTTSSGTITKVDFYLANSLVFTDTSAPYSYLWDTTQTADGTIAISATATRNDGHTATTSISVIIANGNGSCGTPPCPESPSLGAAESSSAPIETLGVLSSEWTLGETDTGSTLRVVVDLNAPQSGASTAENASRIFRPMLPLSLFTTYLQWRLIVRDWSKGTAGNVTAFILRFEARSDPSGEDLNHDGLPDGLDTDQDGIRDGTEVNKWHTLPITRDSDLDGLSDDYEVAPHSLTVATDGNTSISTGLTTDPTKWDADGDGLSDGQERGVVTTGQSKVIGEVGVVRNMTASWTTVYLRNHYTQAVVIAEPSTFRDRAFSHVRIQGVTDHSFQAKVEKWVSGGSGAAEDVAYLVVEGGNHMLPDGTLVEAGRATVSTGGTTVSFREAFATVPIVFVQAQPATASIVLVAKRTNVFSGVSFGAYLNTNGSGTSTSETVGYVAVSPQANPTVLATWTRTEVSAPNSTFIWSYPASFSATPLLLAWMQGEVSGGNKNIGVRLSSASNRSATLFREQAGTAPADTIELLAFSGPTNLTARMTTKPSGTGSSDTDGDTLSDGTEVNVYGSNPTLRDTDADGLPDNNETTSRTITIPVNGTAKSFTFTTSPTSDDTDADGVKDPDELAGILDHRVLFYDMSTTTDTTHLRDLSGSGNTGTMTETGTGTLKIGNARDFDGVNDKVAATIPGMSRLTMWSFSLWFQWDNGANTPSYQHPIGFGSAYDVTIYMNKATLTLYLKATDASGNVVAEPALQTFTSTTSKNPHHVAVTFDGTSLGAWVDGVAKGPWAASALRIRTDAVRIGTSGAETGNYFDGRIDEVHVWDRALAGSEVTSYYNLTNAGGIVAWLDMETRTLLGGLFDFGGMSHPGVATGTTVVEGRSGFARKFMGGSDGIDLSNTAVSGLLTTATTVDVDILSSSMPASDVSVVARRGQFFLNVTSDGRVQWTLYGAGAATSPLPVPLNRWVRLTGTAYKTGTSTTRFSLYVDGVLVSSSIGGKFPTSTSKITLGYAEGLAHYVGALDEVRILGTEASSWTARDLGIRGIQLNPNATDTDFDGLADGQELFVKTVQTPKRYPLPDLTWTSADPMTLPLSAPGWALASATLMTGFTHPDMGQLEAKLLHFAPSPFDRSVTLRSYANAGEANNFTSYDLLNLGYARDEFLAGGTWVANAYDRASGKTGQIEYYQIQVTLHTLPNRADTDADGLNDSEEMNLGSDGFQTDPWKTDTDSDTINDQIEYAGWSRSGSTIISNPNGFHTDPTRTDTDRDGVADGSDRAPLVDLHMSLELASIHVVGSDDGTSSCYLEPFLVVDVGGERAVSDYACLGSNFWGAFGWWTSFNVPDDISTSTLAITFTAYEYDSNTARNSLALKADGSNAYTYAYAIPDAPNAGVTIFPYESSSAVPRVDYLSVVVHTIAPERYDLYLVVPNDYAGIYNVTDAQGNTVGRRYVGEPRFVSVVFNGTTTKATILVPRSVFFATRMYADLRDAAKLGQLPYKDPASGQEKMKGYQNGTGLSNSDVLQMAFAFDGLADSYLTTILDLLRQNASGATNKTSLAWTDFAWTSLNSPLLLGLPDEAIQAVPTAVLEWSLSRPEYLQEAPPPLPWWEQLWRGFVAVLDEVLTRIRSAIVWVGNLVKDFLTALVNFGSWVGDLTSGNATRVRNAVQAAAKVLTQFVDSFLAAIKEAISVALRPLVQFLENFRSEFLSRMRNLAKALAAWWQGDPNGLLEAVTEAHGLAALLSVVGLAIGIPLLVLSVTVSILSAPISFAMSLVASVASSAILEVLGGILSGSSNAVVQVIGWLLSGDFLSVLDKVTYDILGVSPADLPPDTGNPNLETFFGMLAAALVGTAFVVFLAGGFNVAKTWRNARLGNDGLVGYKQGDAINRATAAAWGFGFLFGAVFFALAAVGAEPKSERIIAGFAAIAFGLASLAAVHASLPHNKDPFGNPLTTQILPGWVKLLTDLLGLLSIAASVAAILTAKDSQ